MEDSSYLSKNIDLIFNKLENFLRNETILGKPVQIGETTLVPIISLMFGCGTGQGEDKSGNNGSGSGIGVGARIIPNALIVIKKDEVTMLPIKSKNNLEGLMDMVPDVLSKLNFRKDKPSDKEDIPSQKAKGDMP